MQCNGTHQTRALRCEAEVVAGHGAAALPAACLTVEPSSPSSCSPGSCACAGLQAIVDPTVQRPFVERLLAGLVYAIGPLLYIFILAHFVMAILAWPFSSLRVGLKMTAPPGVPQVRGVAPRPPPAHAHDACAHMCLCVHGPLPFPHPQRMNAGCIL